MFLIKFSFISEKAFSLEKDVSAKMKSSFKCKVFLLAFLIFSFVEFKPCQGLTAGGSNWNSRAAVRKKKRIKQFRISYSQVGTRKINKNGTIHFYNWIKTALL